MDKCDAKNILIINRIKITNQRLSVLNEIINSEQIFSANSLFEVLSDNVDLATIYRILKLFKKKLIIREIGIKDNIKFYELSCIHHPVHPHFLCKKCNTLYCLEKIDDESFKILSNLAKDHIVENIQLLGICNKCK